jgi:hypothetical protein
MAPRRVLKSPALRVVRDHYELDKWAKRMPAEQRRKYFELIDVVVEKMTELKGSGPTDEQLIQAVSWATEEDDTVTTQVMKNPGTALTDEKEWDKIFQAAAGAVLQEHATAVDKGEWP